VASILFPSSKAIAGRHTDDERTFAGGPSGPIRKSVVSTLLLRTSLTASVDGCSEHAEARRTGLLGKEGVDPAHAWGPALTAYPENRQKSLCSR